MPGVAVSAVSAPLARIRVGSAKTCGIRRAARSIGARLPTRYESVPTTRPALSARCCVRVAKQGAHACFNLGARAAARRTGRDSPQPRPEWMLGCRFVDLVGGPDMIVRNRVLACLDRTSFRALAPHLKPVSLRRRAILQDHHHQVDQVHFIERGIASVYARTRSDGPVEVAIVGRFGLVGVSAILGVNRSPNRCQMQVPGEALSIPTLRLRQAMDAVPRIRQHFLNYVHALMVQNTQVALCAARHHLEQRLCRWLLLTSERLEDTVIPITHEMLSVNLGVRRAGISVALLRLQDAGAVETGRGVCVIRDRSLLEQRSCECYAIIAAEYRRLAERGSYDHVLDASQPAEPSVFVAG
jgi:CRP-like cAMP-binding protein